MPHVDPIELARPVDLTHVQHDELTLGSGRAEPLSSPRNERASDVRAGHRAPCPRQVNRHPACAARDIQNAMPLPQAERASNEPGLVLPLLIGRKPQVVAELMEPLGHSYTPAGRLPSAHEPRQAVARALRRSHCGASDTAVSDGARSLPQCYHQRPGAGAGVGSVR